MRKALSLCLSVLILCCIAYSVAAAQDAPAPGPTRGPSTPEERKRIVNIAHKLQSSPLDTGLNADIKWALKWIEDVPDVTVNLCWTPLDDAIQSDFKYRTRIPALFAIASAAFLVEHPDKAHDQVAPYLAGVEGTLKAYKAMRKSDPEAKSDAMEELLQKQSDGTLEDFVRKAAEDCQERPNKSS